MKAAAPTASFCVNLDTDCPENTGQEHCVQRLQVGFLHLASFNKFFKCAIFLQQKSVQIRQSDCPFCTRPFRVLHPTSGFPGQGTVWQWCTSIIMAALVSGCSERSGAHLDPGRTSCPALSMVHIPWVKKKWQADFLSCQPLNPMVFPPGSVSDILFQVGDTQRGPSAIPDSTTNLTDLKPGPGILGPLQWMPS